jgi:hypothetical protein
LDCGGPPPLFLPTHFPSSGQKTSAGLHLWLFVHFKPWLPVPFCR